MLRNLLFLLALSKAQIGLTSCPPARPAQSYILPVAPLAAHSPTWNFSHSSSNYAQLQV